MIFPTMNIHTSNFQLTVITNKAESAPDKTVALGCRIAINAAIIKVSSPISVTSIIEKLENKASNTLGAVASRSRFKPRAPILSTTVSTPIRSVPT